jgi:PAS domain S-box-containing protein
MMISDPTPQQPVNAEANLNEIRMSALLTLNQMSNATLKEIADFALEASMNITDSKLGYLAFMNEDGTILTMYAWSKSAMQECAVSDKPIEYPIEKTGLWGEAVRQRKPIVTNDYAAPDPLKKGLPDGHVALHRHMNVPVFDGEQIVAVAGVANKETEYTEMDVRQLTLLMGGMWQLVQRKQTESTYRNIVENIQDGLVVTDGKKAVYVNDRLCQIMGYSKEELAHMTGVDMAAPEEKERLRQIMREARESKTPISTLEYWTLHKDGSRRYIHNRYITEHEEGKAARRFIFTTDLTERKLAEAERAQMQEQIIEAQRQALQELSTPIIPVLDRIIVMPLIGSIDTMRAKDITRALLAGISRYRAKIVIVDITGVPIVDSGVADHLNKTIQAARLKGAQTIVTGMSDAVAEAIIDLGIDWSGIQTLSDLQTGLMSAISTLGMKLSRQ